MRVGTTFNLKASPRLNSNRCEYYLLDRVSGAVMAHSLRRLNGNYSGNCMTLRSTIQNRTLDVGFIKNNYSLDYVDISSVASHATVNSDNIAISVWNDQSGNANDATFLSGALGAYMWDSNPTRYNGYTLNNEKFVTTDYWPSRKYFSTFFFNGLGELECFKFAAPSTNFTFYIVGSTLDVTGNNKNIMGTDGFGFNSNGMYIQNNLVVFNRSGGTNVIGSDVAAVNSKIFLFGIQHYSNNTARAFSHTGEGPLVTLTGGWTSGGHSKFKLGSYWSSAVSRQTALSLQGYVLEIVAWPSIVPIGEIITDVNKFYNL